VLSNSAAITAPGVLDLVPANNQSGPITTTVLPAPIAPVAPVQVLMSGPTTGLTNTLYTFMASVGPISTTLPLTFTWNATDQATDVHTSLNTLTDTVTSSWATSGTKRLGSAFPKISLLDNDKTDCSPARFDPLAGKTWPRTGPITGFIHSFCLGRGGNADLSGGQSQVAQR
jgi:hypothetical protein